MKSRKLRNLLIRRRNEVIDYLASIIKDEPRVRDAISYVCNDISPMGAIRSEKKTLKTTSESLDLISWRKWLDTTRRDEELSRLLLGDNPDEDDSLVRLIVRGSNWGTLQEAWEIVAKRCVQSSRAATPFESLILKTCLTAHNLIWKDKKAQQIFAAHGDKYEGKLHRRAGLTGDRVNKLLLAGIQNAGGEIILKPLVETE